MTSPGAQAANARPRRRLRDPSSVEELTDRALHGEDVDELLERPAPTGRFERERVAAPTA